MNRPGRRVLLAVALPLLLAGASWKILRGSAGPSRPNIVLVVWDTCRGDRVEVNGFPRPTTPNLVRLAAEGTTFRQCFTPSPWTPPAHGSLFTGLLPRRHGLREGVGDQVRPGIPLLAETLRDAGYETACVVANSHISTITGLDRGFDRRIQCFDCKVPGAAGMDVGDRVLEWLDGRARAGGERPFFLFVNLMESHVPYTFEDADVAAVRGPGAAESARAAVRELSEAEASPPLAGIHHLDPSRFPGLNAAYEGAVRLADRTTGRILDRLRADGLLDGSLVLVCGDHGENLGEHGVLGHVQSVSESVLRVPLVVRWPGRFPAGAVENAQVRLQDAYPTVLDAAGVAAPAPCGKDAVSLLERPVRSRVAVAEFGPSMDHIPEVVRLAPGAPPEVFEAMFRALVAVREPSDLPGARKFVSVVRTSVGGAPEPVREEIYDLAADPGEERNLLSGAPAPAERATADRLRELGGK